jgi:hypothetical protein
LKYFEERREEREGQEDSHHAFVINRAQESVSIEDEDSGVESGEGA